jgi:hypothetical protein
MGLVLQLSRQLRQQRLSLLQVGRGKTLGEPALDRCQELVERMLKSIAPATGSARS